MRGEGIQVGTMDATPRAATDFTLLVVSDHSRAVRRYRVGRQSIRRAAWAAATGLALLVVTFAVAAYRYHSAVGAATHNLALAQENAQLRAQLKGVQDRVSQIATTLERVERFDAKLRSDVAELRPGRRLGVAPSGGGASLAVGAPAGPSGGPAVPVEAENYPATLDTLAGVAAQQERSLRDLHGYFEKQRTMLASAPSTWPARGWVTSDFGTRVDPITAERVMHQGLDIATAQGHPVTSPSEGTVVFAGVENGYGKVITVDHGYGVQTRYGHLSEIAVRSGERVKRGARLGAVGSTGRSTGPHLHYEVRVNGIPENPRKFILE
jgi:murein DD-endopeptidase MepM/ murein hydrolase activator NlpD